MADRFVWTGADGTVIDLTDEAAGYSVLANGTRGLRSVPYSLTADEFAGIDGVQVQVVKAAANTPTLGLLVEASDEATFLARARGLVRAMRPKAGPGTLTVYQGDGTSRTLTCYATEGLEGDWAADSTLEGSWWRLAVKLFAADPWWYGSERTIDFGLEEPPDFFPIFPLVLAPSSVQGEFTVDLSDADSESFPLWTITGPGTSLTLTNDTTGRSLTIAASLSAGESMVVDTRPGRQAVYRGDLADTDPAWNLMASVSSAPDFWPLIEGVNEVTAGLAGATSDSRVTVVYQPRYSGI